MVSQKVAAAISAVIALAPLASAQNSPPDQNPARVEGHVLNINGEPIPRATVHLQGGERVAQSTRVAGLILHAPEVREAITDEGGKFIFENLPPANNYQMQADKPGFLIARYGARSQSSPTVNIALTAGANRAGLDIQMTPQGTISGRVVDGDGDPIANARISVYRYGYSRNHRQLIQFDPPRDLVTSTIELTRPRANEVYGAVDDQGTFRLTGLPSGRYYVRAEPTYSSSSGQKPVNVATYYPNSLDAEGAVGIEVVPGGEVRGIEIRLRKERLYSIEGKILGTSSQPLSGARISVLLADAPNRVTVPNGPKTLADGSFEIHNLFPGRYRIQGEALALPAVRPIRPEDVLAIARKAQRTTYMEVTITNSDITDLVLRVGESFDVTGVVRVESRDLQKLVPLHQQVPPNPDQAPEFSYLTGGRGISLEGIEGATDMVTGQFSDDGKFTISQVRPAKYIVDLSRLEKGVYVKSIKLSGRDIGHEELDLTAGGSPNLEIVLSDQGADFMGTLRDEKGNPLVGVPVTFWPKTPDPGARNMGLSVDFTNKDGKFGTSHIVPGDYFVAAWEDLPELGMEINPDFLARFATDEFLVHLDEKAHATSDLKLVPRARIVAELAKLP